MISTHPQSSWPWQRMAPHQRPLMTVAFVLISMSGLLAGLALRPLTQSLFPGPNQANGAHSATAATPPTATAAPTLPAQNFYIGLKASPGAVTAGDTFTATATAKLSSNDGPAQGVACAITITGPATIAVPTPTLTTDANGKASWTITVPASVSKGGYTLTVTGKWGIYGATWETSLDVQGA